MSSDLIKLAWTRPKTTEYPKVWRKFKARGLNTNQLVEYRIQDLPESRFDDALNHMVTNYMMAEPVTQALNGSRDAKHIADNLLAWRSTLQQKCTLACFVAGSNQIVGINMNYVCRKGDEFIKQLYKRSQSPITKEMLKVIKLLYKDFDPYKSHGVSEYLTAFGLSVEKRYRGRSIGTQLLDARKDFCREFGLKISHNLFSSDFAIRNAEQVGFKPDASITYEELRRSYPEFRNIKTKHEKMSMQTLIVET